MTFAANATSVSDAFSGRPNISLRLNVSEAQVAGTNRSTISWSLQLVETVSQPSFNLNATSTASLSFTLGTGVTLYSGDNTPAIAKYSYDFQATGLQTKTIGSGSFVVTHTDAGDGTISAVAAATDVGGNLGSASITAKTWTLLNFDTTPNAVSVPTVTQYGGGSFNVAVTNPGTANGGPATSVYFNVYDATTGNWLPSNASITNYTPGPITLTADHQYIFRSVAINSQATEYSGNTAQYAGSPSVATSLSATESSTQSRDVTISWTLGANNGSALTSQTVEWSTGLTDATFSAGYVGGVILNGTATSYTITPSSAPTAGTSVLSPSTKYSYRVTETNALGSTGTTISDPSTTFTTRASSPFVSPSANTAPNTRSSTKVWNGTGMVQGQVMVYDGTTPYNVSGWKYLK